MEFDFDFDEVLDRKLTILYDIYRVTPVLDKNKLIKGSLWCNTAETHEFAKGHLRAIVCYDWLREGYLFPHIINLIRDGEVEYVNDILFFSADFATEEQCNVLREQLKEIIENGYDAEADDVCKNLMRHFFANNVNFERNFTRPKFLKDVQEPFVRQPHIEW